MRPRPVAYSRSILPPPLVMRCRKYAAVHATCETAQPARGDVARGVRAVLEMIAIQASRLPEPVRPEPVDAVSGLAPENRLHTYLTRWSERSTLDRVERVLAPLLAGERLGDAVVNDDVRFIKDVGLIASGSAGLEIANPIYKEIIPRALTWLAEQSVAIPRTPYITADGRLRHDALLDGAIDFWKEHAEWMLRRQPYSEAAAQLVLMAFLRRVVNGTADELGRGPVPTIDRAYAVGSGRIDHRCAVVTAAGAATVTASGASRPRRGHPRVGPPSGLERISSAWRKHSKNRGAGDVQAI